MRILPARQHPCISLTAGASLAACRNAPLAALRPRVQAKTPRPPRSPTERRGLVVAHLLLSQLHSRCLPEVVCFASLRVHSRYQQRWSALRGTTTSPWPYSSSLSPSHFTWSAKRNGLSTTRSLERHIRVQSLLKSALFSHSASSGTMN